MENIKTDGKHHLSPTELVLDVPHDVGCFEELSDISSISDIFTDESDLMSPAWCISKCLSQSKNKRYACKFACIYNSYSILQELPFLSFEKRNRLLLF